MPMRLALVHGGDGVTVLLAQPPDHLREELKKRVSNRTSFLSTRAEVARAIDATFAEIVEEFKANSIRL